MGSRSTGRALQAGPRCACPAHLPLLQGLPLSLNLSWLEQKAIVVLLTLLHLGIKNIR